MDLFHAASTCATWRTWPGGCWQATATNGSPGNIADLAGGDIPAILAVGRDLKFRRSLPAERDKALHYFEINAHRMHYAWCRSPGLFVGSGVVQADCKSVITSL